MQCSAKRPHRLWGLILFSLPVTLASVLMVRKSVAISRRTRCGVRRILGRLWATWLVLLRHGIFITMSSSGAVLLNAFPLKMVRLACTRCPRKGQYLKATLIAEYGAAIPLPTLRTLIAKCENEGKFGTACGIYYVDLKPKD
jgi:hypothetical protein